MILEEISQQTFMGYLVISLISIIGIILSILTYSSKVAERRKKEEDSTSFAINKLITSEEDIKKLSDTNFDFYYIDNKLSAVDRTEYRNKISKLINDKYKVYQDRQYLTDTDYIVTKLAEAQIEDSENFIVLKTKYADILAKRKEARDEINSLSESLAQLETLTNS